MPKTFKFIGKWPSRVLQLFIRFSLSQQWRNVGLGRPFCAPSEPFGALPQATFNNNFLAIYLLFAFFGDPYNFFRPSTVPHSGFFIHPIVFCPSAVAHSGFFRAPYNFCPSAVSKAEFWRLLKKALPAVWGLHGLSLRHLSLRVQLTNRMFNV